MKYDTLRKGASKDRVSFILHAGIGATVNFRAVKNKARDDYDATQDLDLDTSDTTTDTTSTTTSTTSTAGNLSWDNLFDNWDISSIPGAASSASTSARASAYSNKDQFRTDMMKGLEALGYTGETAQALVAQMGLETGHGAHMAGDYNYGNITAGKGWTGATRTAKDNQNGKDYTFRSYSNLQDGLRDYIDLASRVYGIKPGDTKDQVYAKLNGENAGKRKWAEAANYLQALNGVYQTYWG